MTDVRTPSYPMKMPTPGYRRAGWIAAHILVAETALGRYLPRGAMVHHVDGGKTDFSNGNLVICQDHAYHMLLHLRQRALDACGHAGWRKCPYCKRYDEPANLFVQSVGKGSRAYHADCHAADKRSRYVAHPKAVLSDAERQEALDLRRQGLPQREIAQRLGYSQPTISRLLSLAVAP